MCPNPVTKPRREYCSKECLEKRLVISRAAFARRKVFERDHGVCRSCGIDCERLRVAYERARSLDFKKTILRCRICEYVQDDPAQRICVGCGAYGRSYRAEWPKRARSRIVRKFAHLGFKETHFVGVLWEADHEIPVSEGGGMCGLENLRTLCKPCHNAATAALAKRIAHKRRADTKRDQRSIFATGGGNDGGETDPKG
jgi:5-methylcytosine-specific restriction endonuclease McrA